ncbi:TOM1-like protein [Arachis hypogaea]|nr:TOM1-like protein [Arachis hypogaea]
MPHAAVSLSHAWRQPSVPLVSATHQRHSSAATCQRQPFDFLPLVLLETIVKNCEKAFSEVAAERVLDDMVSLKSKGIRFPGCHNESLAPIFTPPRSVSEVELDLPRQTQHDDIPVQSFTPEQTKEAFDVARNSIELLSTVLSSPQQDVLQVKSVGVLI